MKTLLIIGPTGIGKSDLALALAKNFQGEIVNADSRQVYQDLQIGTGRPTDFENIPHHLYGTIPLSEKWDAHHFQQEAFQIVGEITGRRNLPIVVGGTGLYLKALLYGLFESPPIPNEIRTHWERELVKTSSTQLHEILKTIDPEKAFQIHPHDSVRVLRALEIHTATGKTMSEWQKEHGFQKARLDYLKIGLTMDRELLYQKINTRVEVMIQQGLEEEAQQLWKKPLQDRERVNFENIIGYQEWIPYFEGKVSQQQVVEQIQQNTRKYAKRQMTWFRQEKDIVWVPKDNLEEMSQKIYNWFNA